MLVRMNTFPLRRWLALLSWLAIPCATLAAELPPRISADVPQERTDANSRQAHQDLLAKRGKGKIDLYFVGDSITRRWGAAEPKYSVFLAHWQKSFHGWNAADFGWGGDTTNNILWRLDHEELTGVNPRVIVIMAGTNNLPQAPSGTAPEAVAADVAKGIEAILKRCQQLAPQARIVLMGITPRNDDMRHMPVIERVNAQLAPLADGTRVKFIDLRSRLADAQGMLLPGMTDPDKLHLALPGYEAWAQALRPVLLEWLGPPAREDRGPPPTGDPSAMQAAR
jgi:lysophospholipase L1-like esterase